MKPKEVWALARPRRMRCSAPAVLVWSLLLYGLSALTLDVIMDRWRPTGFEQNYWRKWRKFRQFAAEDRQRPLAVMLGSSRTAALFKAGLMDGKPSPYGQPWRAYNFGVPATGPMREWMHLRDMIDEGIRPRLLLVEFLPPLLNEAHTGLYTEENWSPAEWMTVHQYLRLRPYLFRPFRKANQWVEARVAPWHIHRLCLHSWLHVQLGLAELQNIILDKYDHWGCRDHEMFNDKQRAFFSAAARDYIPSLQHFRLGEGLRRALHDMLGFCRQQDIPVVLILTPESSDFRSWYPPKCLAAVDGLLAELKQTYGVRVVDARQWLEDDEFVDGHHANARGSCKFTVRLLKELHDYLPDKPGNDFTSFSLMKAAAR